MTISERRFGDVTFLELAGRLVFDDGDDDLRSRVNSLVSEGRLKILIGLTGVAYIDSCGVGVLVAKFVSVRRLGGDLRLLGLSPRCQHVLTISGLMKIFQVFEAEPDALASFGWEAPA